MLLAIDMGNTQTALGLFDNEELLHSWRMPTDRTFTKDELHVRLLGYFHKDGFDLAQVNAIAFAGVVPQLMREWEGVAEVLNARLVVVGRATASVTSIDAANPAEVGADRIANATAAAALYGSPASSSTSAPPRISTWSMNRAPTSAVASRPASAYRLTRSPPAPRGWQASLLRRLNKPWAATPSKPSRAALSLVRRRWRRAW